MLMTVGLFTVPPPIAIPWGAATVISAGLRVPAIGDGEGFTAGRLGCSGEGRGSDFSSCADETVAAVVCGEGGGAPLFCAGLTCRSVRSS